MERKGAKTSRSVGSGQQAVGCRQWAEEREKIGGWAVRGEAGGLGIEAIAWGQMFANCARVI